MSTPYDDIINLPHPVSISHPRMRQLDRAAQFSPFAALTGYDAAVAETGRLTDERLELAEEEKEVIGLRLQLLLEHLDERPEVTIIYFVPDERKTGGAYKSVTGIVKKIDEYERSIALFGGERIPIEEVSQIEGELFKGLDAVL